MLALISASQWSALKMTCVSSWDASGQAYLKGGGMLGALLQGKNGWARYWLSG